MEETSVVVLATDLSMGVWIGGVCHLLQRFGEHEVQQIVQTFAPIVLITANFLLLHTEETSVIVFATI